MISKVGRKTMNVTIVRETKVKITIVRETQSKITKVRMKMRAKKNNGKASKQEKKNATNKASVKENTYLDNILLPWIG